MLIRYLRNKINRYPLILAFLSGLLCAIAHAPLFFTPGLIGFSILAYLIYSSKDLRSALVRNLSFCLGYFGYGLYWIVIGISVYIEDFWWAIPISLFGMPLLFSIFTSFPTYVAWNMRNSTHYILVYSIAWVFIEWVTTWIFTGFPWMLIGYTSGFSNIISQLASICGVIGISFVIFYIMTSFYYMWEPDAKLCKKDVFFTITLLGIISIFGVIRLEQNPTIFTDKRIRIIQPSIPQISKWDPEIFWQNLELHRSLSFIKTQASKPDIILWSEAAVTAPIQLQPVRNFLNIVAKETNAILVTGTVSHIEDKLYTSIDAISPSGKILFEYHKKHLIPFGEYVPLKNILPIKKLTHGIIDYTAGTTDAVFNIIGLKTRPLICYETVFAKEAISNDVDIFLNITNNAWYGKSAGPYQHFYIGKFRSIENSIPLITAANNGISGIIDPMGRILNQTHLDDITALDAFIPKKYNSPIYTKLGDFGILLIIFMVILLRIIFNLRI
ncbi:MAG: Apolipoprotein N-acyltransferase [Pseudomonadota bacterium]|jgi:apolipoprotein N-acyltransferase